MKSLYIILIVIGFGLLALMATNPSIEDHRQAVVKFMKNNMNYSSSINSSNDWASLGQAVGLGIIQRAVGRQNFILFSLTTIASPDRSTNVIGFGFLGFVKLFNKSNNNSSDSYTATTDTAAAAVDTDLAVAADTTAAAADVSSFQIGFYTVRGNDEGKAHFFSSPDQYSQRSAYLFRGDDVYIERIQNGFGYTEFTNTQGRTSKGWIDMYELIIKQ